MEAYWASQLVYYGIDPITVSVIYDPKYNCHAWAWGGIYSASMGEGQASLYWDKPGYTGGGYVNVTNTPDAATASHAMYGITHSALGSSTDAYHTSKWGDGPLVSHYPHITPYSSHPNGNPTPYGLPTAYYKKATYTVTFNSNGGNPYNQTQSVTAGPNAKVSAPSSNPTHQSGYAFLGWYEDAGGTIGPFNFNTQIKVSTTLYAKWNIPTTYTVSFDANGGSPTPQSQTVQHGNYATKPTPDPTKVGYSFTFGGWATTSNGTTAINFSTHQITSNQTLYAIWIQPVMNGPSSLSQGGYYSFDLPYVAGASYSWSGSGIDLVYVGNGDNNAMFYVPYGSGYYGYANCAVTYSGVTSYFSKSAPIY